MIFTTSPCRVSGDVQECDGRKGGGWARQGAVSESRACGRTEGNAGHLQGIQNPWVRAGQGQEASILFLSVGSTSCHAKGFGLDGESTNVPELSEHGVMTR